MTSNENMKGQHVGLSGDTYDFEAVNAIPGRIPTSMWAGMEHQEHPGSAVVALVGVTSLVQRFALCAKKLTRQQVAYGLLESGSLSLSVFTAGLWPTDERAVQIVREMNLDGSGGPEHWATVYAELVKDPDRTPLLPSLDFTRELAELFVQQCRETHRRGLH